MKHSVLKSNEEHVGRNQAHNLPLTAQDLKDNQLQ